MQKKQKTRSMELKQDTENKTKIKTYPSTGFIIELAKKYNDRQVLNKQSQEPK